MNSTNILSDATVNFEYFNEINYSILESGFWPEVYKLFDEFNLPYYFIGLNVFKNKSICPILIDFNAVEKSKKRQVWEEIFLNTTNSYDSEFDKIYLFQNLIKSNMALNDFMSLIGDVISFNKKNVFRAYDPRVALHLGKFFPDFYLLSKCIQEWRISLNGKWYTLNFIENNKLSKNLSEIETINWKIRSEIDLVNIELDFNSMINKVYGEFYD